jgi:hypothetical protein
VIAYVVAGIVVDKTNVALLGGGRSQGREEGLRSPLPVPARFLSPDPVIEYVMAGIVVDEPNVA